MAARKPWYTSKDLVEAVKRKCSFPLSQVTFSEDDILLFATEELFLEQVPSLIQYHEEYLVYTHRIKIEDNVSRYDIPSRAVGMKLRDFFFEDTDGNLYEMINVGLSNSDFYQGNFNNYQNPRNFYVEGDELVILPSVMGATPGYFVMKYYLRPNSLVLNERAAICKSFIKQITVNNTNLVVGSAITIGTTVLIADTDFAIGANSAATASNLANAISNITGVDANSNTTIVDVSFMNRNMMFSTDTETGFIISPLLGIASDSIPENFADGILCDFLQTDGGHKTYVFDIPISTGGVSATSVFFDATLFPLKFKVGDYICEQNESIIPQIPSDLHNLLAERTCSRLMAALGDKEGQATSDSKIERLEQRQATLLDNRVEGAPRKVFNRHSALRAGKFRGAKRSSL